jgi:hypothetical protein
LSARGYYELPGTLARHVPASGPYQPGELREVCRPAGDGLGREDAALGEFRSAADMVSLWQGLDLPAWEAPYTLRAARLGYLSGFGAALTGGSLNEETAREAASARWGERGPERLRALRERQGGEGGG